MKKTILLCSLLGLITNLSFSQVGVSTENPQGIFHVDAKGNNEKTGVPSVANITDDIVVSNTGNVGVGVVAPTVKLDVKGGVRLVDGTQQTDRMLASRSPDGKAKWANKPQSLIKNGVINDNSGRITESAMNITTTPVVLDEGRWLIVSKFVVKRFSGNTAPNQNIWIYLRNETLGTYETIIGLAVEQNGTYEGTPQLSYIVKVPEGSNYTYNIYASTSNGGGGNNALMTTEPNFQGSYFYALRLDQDTL